MRYMSLIAILALCGCAPKGYHEVCDQWTVYMQYIPMGGKGGFILIPENICAKSHYEKDKN